LKFVDTGKSSGLYDAIYGTTTNLGTYVIGVTLSFNGYPDVSTNVTIVIVAGSSGSSAPVITNQPVSLTNNVGSNVTFSVTAGTAPLNYQWKFDTNTALLNATNSSLTLTNIQLTNAGTYSVVVTNSSGSVTSSFASLTVWQPPVITNQPVSVTNLAGSSTSFSVTAGGVPVPAYQWEFNTNTVLPNATNTSLSLTNLRASQAGTYNLVITNSAGSVTSSIASLVITNPLPAAFAPNAPTKIGSAFQFTFTPVIGLTNTVLTNGVMTSTNWGVLTNIPPPVTATPIIISHTPGMDKLFYRVVVQP